MNVATEFAACSLDEIQALLAGGTLTVYSVARPASADLPVDRSGVLATFTFATPAFAADGAPAFVEAAVPAATVGTPGFARARKADGTVVADFSAGPGNREIKFAEVSCSPGAPVRVTAFQVLEERAWPERPDYFNTRPRAGFPLHGNP
ncbi:hypothetical protein [Paracraurococcus lichenis]|uniref:Uncharacterized protein n=1 Tax=Paracraurococcus lichenis TaxID=3064888 RepID=A0ABT9DYF6_9PROT|nr:hypothetical protein [Paracraurococcus sp. LOR1-02]MDO9708927.1 hypothetical protein [Paracraurococcus sp. LOR1-02]